MFENFYTSYDVNKMSNFILTMLCRKNIPYNKI